MSVRLLVHNFLPASASPYRLVDDRGCEVTWVNQFLDAQKLRQLSLRSLRIYAYDLLHLARWFKNTRHSLARLNQSLLLNYVRYQLEQKLSPTAQTINHLVRGALPLSLPLRTRDSRQTALSAQVYHALSARLWSSAPEDHYPSATLAAAPCDRAPVRRPGGWFLERLSHLPRPGHRGSDVA